MSKYGFNENEVRKTIITKIDKDGFHKEETFDGNVDGGSSDLTIVTMTVTGESDIDIAIPEIFEGAGNMPACLICGGMQTIQPGDEKLIPLYKGTAMVSFPDTVHPERVAVEGDAEKIGQDAIVITGDFSIGLMTL